MTEKPDQMPALQLESVSKSFGGVRAVQDVSLTVPQGECRALIGPNGAGKTTLFNVIAGTLKCDSGTITMFGQNITRKPMQGRARLGLGRTYQISQLFLALSVEENLFLATAGTGKIRLNPFKLWTDHAQERDWATQIARRVRLEDKLKTPVAELSHGEQRQLEIGMALAMKPRLVMLDEPAAGLSPSERSVITEMIDALERDITLILIEHDMDIALGLADQVTVMHQGQIIAAGTPGEIRTDAQVQAVYLGTAHV